MGTGHHHAASRLAGGWIMLCQRQTNVLFTLISRKAGVGVPHSRIVAFLHTEENNGRLVAIEVQASNNIPSQRSSSAIHRAHPYSELNLDAFVSTSRPG